jgi:hypothetical protein
MNLVEMKQRRPVATQRPAKITGRQTMYSDVRRAPAMGVPTKPPIPEIKLSTSHRTIGMHPHQ